MENEIYEKIIAKREFSRLPKKDVELAFSHFERRQCSDEEKIRLTRDLLRKVFSAFASGKILSLKNKSPEWILRKHLSTRERMPHYKEIYSRILKGINGAVSVIDLGAGINGFSYKFMTDSLKDSNLRLHKFYFESSFRRRQPPIRNPACIGFQNSDSRSCSPSAKEKSENKQNPFKKTNLKINYTAVESMGQLVGMTNHYFKNEKISGKAFHVSLFELEKIRKIILEQKKPRIVFLFKVVDSLEMLENNYSKKLLLEIAGLCDFAVLSFATRSMIKRTKFSARRNWIFNFIGENFEIIDGFEYGSERYVVFRAR